LFRDTPVPKRPAQRQHPRDRSMKWKNLGVDTTTFFITATITEWQPLLAQPEARDIVLQDLEFYRAKYRCKILAYVIMPEHYHILVDLDQPSDLSDWLRDLQGHSASEISKWLQQTATAEELAVYARHANGRSKLAIWKEQARALGIVSESVLETKIEYVHKNPVRRGLTSEPGEWPWSSWRNYYLDDDSILRIDR
jgi:putative transposase